MATVADDVEPLLASGRAVEAADVLLALESRVEFLDVDVELVRALEDVLVALPATEHARISRVAARLAYELRGDPATADLRRELLDRARRAAGDAADDLAAVEALLATIHALWEPAGAEERLAAAERVIALTRRTHDVEHELEARLARFQALVEIGRVRDAELELASYARLGEPRDRPELRAFLASRRAILAVIQGRYDDVREQSDLAYTAAVEAGMPDAERLRAVGQYVSVADRGFSEDLGSRMTAQLRSLAVRMPGHYFEATTAWALLRLGRRDEARLELARVLPQLLTTTGYRWLHAAAVAAEVAAEVGPDEACAQLYDALLPHGDRLLVQGPAFGGAVADLLGVLATRLGRLDEAVGHLRAAVATLDVNGALPWAAWARVHLAAALRDAGDAATADVELAAAVDTARALGMTRLLEAVEARPTDAWQLVQDGSDWLLEAGEERARFRAGRGFDHLRLLLANPGREVAATELDAGRDAADEAIPVVDQQALAAYRRRLAQLADEIDAADLAGDQARSTALDDERGALLAEVRRATGLGGRPRTSGGGAERARVNVTRNLKRALEQVQRVAPIAGAHLAASVRTGTFCSYEPVAGGPERWLV